MNIIVCVKQVPDTSKVKIDQKNGIIIREGVPAVINPYDKNALEEALVLKEKIGANVIAITMGPAQSEIALREALAMGVDEAVLISDKTFIGSDTLATANVLSSALKKLNYDIILTGAQTIDGGTAQVGPKIAERLKIPQVTFVQKIRIHEEYLNVNRALENEYEIVNVKMPVLVTVVKELNEPRYPRIEKILEAHKKKIEVWTMKNINEDKSVVGFTGSFTKIKKSVISETNSKGEVINKSFKETAAYAAAKLKEKHYI